VGAGALSLAQVLPHTDLLLEERLNRLRARITGGDGLADPVPWQRETSSGPENKCDLQPRLSTFGVATRFARE